MPEPIRRSRSISRLVTAAALSATVLVGGCAGQSGEPGGAGTASVASLPSSGAAGAPSAAPSAAAQRPLIRIDTSGEEIDRMYAAYFRCLKDHGVPSQLALKMHGPTRYKDALAACAAKEPEDFQEREKRENPALFREHQRKQIQCMRAHGMAIVTDPEGFGYVNPARDMGSPWDHKCERLAFGG